MSLHVYRIEWITLFFRKLYKPYKKKYKSSCASQQRKLRLSPKKWCYLLYNITGENENSFTTFWSNVCTGSVKHRKHIKQFSYLTGATHKKNHLGIIAITAFTIVYDVRTGRLYITYDKGNFLFAKRSPRLSLICWLSVVRQCEL